MLNMSESDLPKDYMSHRTKTDDNRLAKIFWTELCVNFQNAKEAYGLKILEAISKYLRKKDTHNY